MPSVQMLVDLVGYARMPLAQDQNSELDVFKSLMYKLCDFLVQERRTPNGYGLRTPMTIPLESLRDLLQYAQGENEEQKIEELRKGLSLLSHEMVPNGSELRSLVTIDADQVQDTDLFRENFNNGGVLRITYTSHDLEEYRNELASRTDSQHRAVSDVTLTPEPSGGVIISLGVRQMHVRRGRDVRNLSVNIISLLWGQQIDPLTGPVPLNDDYERGNHIGFGELIDALNRVSGDQRDSGRISRKSVVDTITRLNKRAERDDVFGRPIIEKDDEGLKWVL